LEIKPSYSVVKQLKSEFKNEKRISTDLNVDAEASKVLCERMCLYSTPEKLQGFVQEINSNPFGLLLMSHMQVKF
jgi:hypothetical protein